MEEAGTIRSAETAYPSRTVAAIVVTTEASPELASTLRALSRQDVPVAILVVDDASVLDPTPVVAEAVPDTFVARLDTMSGWCAAANHGAQLVSGAQWLLICHDDVAPAPDALRSMLDTAEAQGADLVAPKLVSWTDHERLRSVGFSADRSGKAIDRVDENELDQGQHDFVRPTVAIHSACMLVKADTFAMVGGFDTTMSAPSATPTRSRRGASSAEQQRLSSATTAPERGEDLDLCWRIIASGGIAVVDPGARVAHAERRHRAPDAQDSTDATDASPADLRQRDPAAEALRTLIGRRNRLRTVVSVLRGPALLRGLASLLFQRIVLIGADLPFPAVRHLVPRAGVRSLLLRRREVNLTRVRNAAEATDVGALGRSSRTRLRDDARRLEPQLSAGEVTLRKVLRTEVAKDSSQALLLAGDAVAVGWKRGPIRLISGLLIVTMTALFVGSRQLLDGVAAHGQFVPVSTLGDLLRAYASSWRDLGTGTVAPSPPGLLVAMLARIAGLGTDALTGLFTTTLLVPVGMIGAGRLGSAVAKSCRERAVSGEQPDADVRSMEHSTGVLSTALCAALYGAAPVATNAIRTGSWEALLLFAALPWLLQSVLASTGQLASRRSSELIQRLSLASLVRVGLPLGVVASLAPPVAIIVVVVVVLLWIASLIADGTPMTLEERRGPPHSVALVLGSGIVAIVLLCAWVLEIVRTPSLLRGDGPTSAATDVAHVVRLTAGAGSDGFFGAGGWLAAGLFVAAVLTMMLVNGRRLWWAVRWWTVSISFAVAMWCVDRGPFVGLLPSHEVLSVPLALGLVVLVTVGLSGVAQDILRTQFGWRQVAMITAVGAAMVTAIPVVWSARHGDWSGPLSNARRNTQWIAASSDSGRFRTVWIGTPGTIDGDANPVPTPATTSASRPTSNRVMWVLGGVVPPDLTASWGGSPRAGAAEVAAALADAAQRSTFRLGDRLAPAAIRYVVVSGSIGRDAVGADASGPLRNMVAGLEQQLDLREVQRDATTVVYENTRWIARRAVNGEPAFVGAGTRTAIIGTLPPGTLSLADTFDAGWMLTVDGTDVLPKRTQISRQADGTSILGTSSVIGMSFDQPGGVATLRHKASMGWTLARWLQILIWSAAIVAFLLDWSARRRHLEDLVAEIHVVDPSSVPAGDDESDDAWDTSFTVEGAFRPDDEVYADIFDDPFASSRRWTGRGTEALNAAEVVEAAEVIEGFAGESLADQLWSEWATRHGRIPASQEDVPADQPGKQQGKQHKDSSEGRP